MNKTDKFVKTVSLITMIVMILGVIEMVLSLLTFDAEGIVSSPSSSSSSISSSSSTNPVGDVAGGIAAGIVGAIVVVLLVIMMLISLAIYAVNFVVSLVSLIKTSKANEITKSPAVTDLVVSILAIVASAISFTPCVTVDGLSAVIWVILAVLGVASLVLSIIALSMKKKEMAA